MNMTAANPTPRFGMVYRFSTAETNQHHEFHEYIGDNQPSAVVVAGNSYLYAKTHDPDVLRGKHALAAFNDSQSVELVVMTGEDKDTFHSLSKTMEAGGRNAMLAKIVGQAAEHNRLRLIDTVR